MELTNPCSMGEVIVIRLEDSTASRRSEAYFGGQLFHKGSKIADAYGTVVILDNNLMLIPV
jgi:hypothetical protein